MILGAEIGMLVLGLMALTTGKLTLSKKRVVTAPLARPLGFILLMPIPAAYVAFGFIHQYFLRRGWPVGDNSFFWTVTAVEGGIVVACMALVYGIAWPNATDPTAAKDDPIGEPPADLWFTAASAPAPSSAIVTANDAEVAPARERCAKDVSMCAACGHKINFGNHGRLPPWCPACGQDWQLASSRSIAQ